MTVHALNLNRTSKIGYIFQKVMILINVPQIGAKLPTGDKLHKLLTSNMYIDYIDYTMLIYVNCAAQKEAMVQSPHSYVLPQPFSFNC